MDKRPVQRCIYAWPLEGGDYFVRRSDPQKPRSMDATCSLEEAAEYAQLGFEVILDPFDAEDIVRWEQQQRAMQWRKGFGL